MRALLVLVACCAAIAWALPRIATDTDPIQRGLRRLRSGDVPERLEAIDVLTNSSTRGFAVVARALIERLHDEDARVRQRAVTALNVVVSIEAQLRRSRPADPAIAAVVPALVAALRDPDSGVRKQAIASLGQVGTDPRAVVPGLLGALEDADADVRAAAARAWGSLGPRIAAAPPALLAALRDRDRRVRVAAAAALHAFPTDHEVVIPALLAALKHEDEPTRVAAATALQAFPTDHEAVIPALLAALKHGDEPTRVAVAKVLLLDALGMGSDPVGRLTGSPSHPPPNETVVLTMIELLGDPKAPAEIRTWAAQYLGALPPGTRQIEEVRAALGAALEDPVDWVRRAAADAYRASRAPVEIREAGAALLRAMSSREPSARMAAAYALGRITRGIQEAESARAAIAAEAQGAMKALVAALKDEEAGVRRVAADSLGVLLESHSGGGADESDTGVLGRARAALAEAMKDDDEGVRRAARAAAIRLETPDGDFWPAAEDFGGPSAPF